ncbi:MAG: bacteriohemerythrin [Lachnospiraceae bacterium]|nr:bacteriohemerythrin [Lachnospiraceae bacterium]
MFDFKFNWDESLDTGMESIDSQHKELFRIARNMEQLLLTRCIGVQESALLDIVCELREYVSYHFYYEESLMLQAGYVNYEEHKKLHDEFKLQIMNLDCPALAKNPQSELKKLKDTIQEWIFTHMLIEDKKMIKEIK